MSHLGSSRWFGVALCASLLALVWSAMPQPSSADIIMERPLDRKFPQGTFCALPVDLTFTSPSDRVTVEFKALRFVPDPFGGDPLFTGQLIDNVMLATTAVHTANYGPPPAESGLNECYNCNQVFTLQHYFYFNRFASLPLRELFDTNPASSGWDMTNHTYWNTIQTAPRNVENETGFTGGCLLIGDMGTQPDPYATTKKEITGLTPGASYTLSAWWSSDAVVCFTQSPPTYLTITVSGQGPVGVGDQPLAQSSWLGPAAPNPAHGQTQIAYRLSESGKVSLAIYDTQGRRVRGLVSGTQPAGDHTAEWDGMDTDGRRVASGIYFYRLEVPGKAFWGKVVIGR